MKHLHRRRCGAPDCGCAADTPGAGSAPDGRHDTQAAGQPGPLIWQPGHWDWTGSSYVWVPGQYVDLARPQRTWMPGYLGEDRVRLGLAPGALDMIPRRPLRCAGTGSSLPAPSLTAPRPAPGGPCGSPAAVLVPGALLQGLIDVVDVRDRRWDHFRNMRHSA